MQEITYTLIVTVKGNNHTYQLGKELKSPKAIIAALKKTAYPPDFEQLKNIHFVKHTKTIVSEKIDIDYRYFIK